MRVAFDARHAARGLGISTFLVHLARELVALEIEVIWLGDPALAPDGVAGVAGVARLPYPALDSEIGRRLVRNAGADLIHFTGNTGWGRRGPVPAVLTLHDLIFLSTGVRARSLRQIVGHRYERWLIERAVPAASAIAVPSQTVAEEVSRRFGPSVSPVVIHEGVEQDPALQGGAAGGRPSDYLVAFSGRDPRKRTGDVVEGWRAVRDLGLRLRLLASGGIAPELRAELEPDVNSGAVEIVGHLPRHELQRVLAGALALAYPSESEGFGLPVLEAMAAGTPVLAGVAPVTLEIGGAAIIELDRGDIAGSIAAAARRLHGDRAFAGEVRARGLERAGHFSWRQTAEAYRDLYLTVLGGRR